jgi:KDO2-lipid IV(A) lauroyltransferase
MKTALLRGSFHAFAFILPIHSFLFSKYLDFYKLLECRAKMLIFSFDMKKLQHIFEYGLLLALMTFFEEHSLYWAVSFGGFICSLLFHLGIRRDVSRKNYHVAFGESACSKERDRVLLSAYRNFGYSMAEYIILENLSPECLKRLVSTPHRDLLDETAQHKKGAILVTGHLGSWEFLGAWLAENGYPIDFLVGEQHNHYVDDMMNDSRRKKGIGIIQMGVAARGILKSLKGGRMVALLSDQDAGRAGVAVKLFGKDVLTPGGPALFSLKSGSPILTGIIVRNPDKYTHTLYMKTLEIPPLSGNSEDDVRVITQAYTDQLGEYIRQFPEMWFWVHRRFKRVVEY